MDRELWLDGLRGTAALIVAFGHLILDKIPQPFRSYYAEPASANKSLWQLAPIKLLFAPQAMVLIFMAVSGYSISINLIHARTTTGGTREKFYEKLRSAVLRRGVRLYVPALVVAVLTDLFFFLGWYDDWVKPPACPDLVPWRDFVGHGMCSLEYVLRLLDVADLKVPRGIAHHLWTIPVEFKGSLMVYGLVLTLAEVRAKWRLVLVWGLAGFMFWGAEPEMFAFACGLGMVELGALERSELGERRKDSRVRWLLWRFLESYGPIALGIALLCIPSEDPRPEDIWFQDFIAFPRWIDEHIRARMLISLGAVLLVYGLRNSKGARSIFETEPAQFLGKISFALYLIHIPVILLSRSRLLDSFSMLVYGKEFWQVERIGETAGLVLIWMLTGSVMAVALGLLANWASYWVDGGTIRLARWFEKKVQ